MTPPRHSVRPTAAWPGSWYPLGATVLTPAQRPREAADFAGPITNFAVWAPRAEYIELCLFDDDGAERRFTLAERTFDIHHGAIAGVGPGQRYGLRVHGPWDPEIGLRFNPHKLLLDPYARAISGELVYTPEVFGHDRPDLGVPGDDLRRNDNDSAPFVPRSVVVADDFDWGEDLAPKVAWTDTVIYETHVRGLTMTHPGVPDQLRGTYAGLAHPAITDYLVDLGVTTVELLPVQHFVNETHLATSGLNNYWGYNTIGFFAPHSGYSSAGDAGGQVTEFKAMVKALHAVGIEVVLDVVYNHTAEQGPDGPTLSLRGIDNVAYYRVRDQGRRYKDYTGCGNTLDTANLPGLQLVTDSLRYWVREMRVDGFRFDLAPALTRGREHVEMTGAFLTAVHQDEVLREVKLIAEPWDVGIGGYQVGEFPMRWTEWNDKFRDTVRDFWRQSTPGVRELAFRLSGSSDLYGDDGRSPFASINLVTAHDGFTLRDLVTYERKHNGANLEDNRDGSDNNRSRNYGVEGEYPDDMLNAVRRRQIGNFLATLLLSAGVPMMVAGDELGRTQAGNNNAYCQDNDIAWLDWEAAHEWADLTDLVHAVMRLRREHPVLRQQHWFIGSPAVSGGRKDLTWFAPDGDEMTDGWWWDTSLQTLGMFLAGDAIRSRTPTGSRIVDDSYLVWFHAGENPLEVVLPMETAAGARFEVVLGTAEKLPVPGDPVPVTGELKAGDSLVLAARSVLVLRAT